MGRKGGWFSAVKKALSPDSKGKSDQTTCKSKRWFRSKHKDSVAVPSSEETKTPLPIPDPPPPPPLEDVKVSEAEDEHTKHAYSVAIATAKAADAAVAAAQAAAEVVRLTTNVRYSGKSREEIAAIKIQTAFRGYLARRALRALRGLVRLKTLIQGQSVKRQATNTLRCMQTLARVQSQVRTRRIRMSEENRALQRQLQQKHERELEKLKHSMGEEWDDSTASKEQIEAKLLHKQEAAIRRERALAYAYTHQQMWKKSSKSANPTFMDPNNPHWGWSWLERWMAARPWETKSAADVSDRASVKSIASHAVSVGETGRIQSRRNFKHDGKPSPTGKKLKQPQSRNSPSTPTSKAPCLPSVNKKVKSASPKKGAWVTDDDLRSLYSVHSERYRRHSFVASTVGDNESLASCPSVPSYMAPTKAANSRSRPSLLGKTSGTPSEKGSANSAKKRLSFPTSPGRSRRHSGPPAVDLDSVKDVGAHQEEKTSNTAERY